MYQFHGGRKIRQKGKEDVACVFEFKFRILDVTFPPLGEPPGTALVSRRMQFSVSPSFNFLTGSAGDRSRGTSKRRLSLWRLYICIRTDVYVSGITTTLFPNCKLGITLRKGTSPSRHFRVIYEWATRIFCLSTTISVWNNHDGVKPSIWNLNDDLRCRRFYENDYIFVS